LVDPGLGDVAGHVAADGGPDWKAFGLKPWQIDTFKLSTGPLFVDKVKDIVGLHMAPPHQAVVTCVDQKTAVPALQRTQPVLRLLAGTPNGCRTTTSDTARSTCTPR
jgi:hypothetical protein